MDRSEPTRPAGYGAGLIRAAAIMDRLRSPGGCPWDAEQTHLSLAPYLLEESYETLEAIEDADPVALREELGDLLLQVLFHARLAEEAVPTERFGIDDVADDLVAKLIRRHPHVFAEVRAADADAVASNWDEIKKAEKSRTSVLEGIPFNQPALSLAAKLLGRSRRAGLNVATPAAGDLGDRLLALAAEAVDAGQDPELLLRRSAHRLRDRIHQAETNLTSPQLD